MPGGINSGIGYLYPVFEIVECPVVDLLVDTTHTSTVAVEIRHYKRKEIRLGAAGR